MNERTSPLVTTLTVLVVLILVLVGVILFRLFRANAPQQATEYATSTATTSESASSTNAAPARSGAANQPAGQTSPKTLPTRTTSNAAATYYVTPGPAAGADSTNSPNARSCSANDITGTASWQGAGGTLVGAIKVKNSSESVCSLSHDLSLNILSGTTVLSTAASVNPNPAGYTTLSPGEETYVWFSWANWCAGPLSHPAAVRLTLPGNLGYLRVPVIDPSGMPQSDAPRCDVSSAASTVRIWQ